MATLTGERSHLCAIVTLAINTGLRVKELFSLKREDVDRDVLYIKHTKTDEDREVPLNDIARELLRGLIQAERKGSEFLFTQFKDRHQVHNNQDSLAHRLSKRRTLQPSLSRSASPSWNEGC